MVHAYSFLLSRSTQRLHRVPGQGQPQPDTPPLRISAVSLRTYLYEVWRRRCLQVSALKATACKVDICFWSQHIIAATSVRSLGELLRANKLPPCQNLTAWMAWVERPSVGPWTRLVKRKVARQDPRRALHGHAFGSSLRFFPSPYCIFYNCTERPLLIYCTS